VLQRRLNEVLAGAAAPDASLTAAQAEIDAIRGRP
jgi:hypothetical protein